MMVLCNDFYDNPHEAIPDEELYNLLDSIAEEKNTKLVLVSGRDRGTFSKWFDSRNYTLIAEHGGWIKESGKSGKKLKAVRSEWKKKIFPVLESFVDRTPGSFIEEKTYSLAWHYRKSEIELGALRALELAHNISNLISNQDLEILEGKKVVEIKVSGINKGIAASAFLHKNQIDFVMAIGDDWTDEFLFKELPENTYTIKVGNENSAAKYYLNNYQEVRSFLNDIINSKK